MVRTLLETFEPFWRRSNPSRDVPTFPETFEPFRRRSNLSCIVQTRGSWVRTFREWVRTFPEWVRTLPERIDPFSTRPEFEQRKVESFKNCVEPSFSSERTIR